MKLDFIKKLKIPDKPGIYFFMKGKKILYIGKATSLRSRVRSYFSGDLVNTRGFLLVDMVAKSKDIKWAESDSVLEALIEEANLIKKYQPFYNRQEKDDKSWSYVCVTRGRIPIVTLVRGKELEIKKTNFASKYGPFTNGGQLKEAMKIIRPIFPYLDEKSKNYYKFYKQVNWVPDITTERGIREYRQNIKNLKLFFEGKKKKVLKNLEKEMKACAKAWKFERAGEVRNQIFALKHVNDVALLKKELLGRPILGRPTSKSEDFRIEAYDVAHMSGKNMVGVMTVVENGVAEKSDYRKFKIRTQAGSNDTGALVEVLERRMKHQEWRYPNLVVVDGDIAQINAAKSILHKMDLQIEVVSVVKDKYHKPRAILGDEGLARKYKTVILLANSEAHRFAITYHKNVRGKNFLK